MQKEKQLKSCDKKRCHPELDSGSSTQVVTKQHNDNERGRFQIKFGMTASFYNNNGFTLIELLVVVLIIGILAAVALPQYQKAVVKTRYATLKNLTNSLYQAEQTFHLANGEYTNDFDALSIDTPAHTSETKAETVNIRYFPWGLCMIATGTYAQAECVNTKIKMRYTYYFNGIRYCVANTTDQNAIQNQVCKTETGRSQGRNMDSYTVWTY